MGVCAVTDILDDEIKREGGYSNDPNDPGGETMYGLTKKDNPEAWAHGRPTYQQAREIYEKKFLEGWKIGLIKDERLRHQVLDFSINSGYLGIMKLQAILGLEADGHIGPHTLAALAAADPVKVNNQLVDERVKMLCRVVQKQPKLLADLSGLCSRALSFRIL